MKINFYRKKAFGVAFAKVPVFVNNEEVVRLKNGETFTYNGPATTIKLKGPGVVRSVTFDIEVDFEELDIEFNIAMGAFAGGFKVLIKHDGKVVQKLRKTF